MPGTILNRQPTDDRHFLHLGPSFDDFLGGLGRQTRRNVRYYRRRAVSNGWRLSEEMSGSEIAMALKQLAAHQRTSRLTYGRIIRQVDAVKKLPAPVFMGLQTPGGEWLSIVAGWYRGERGHVILQLNRSNAEYDDASLSLVLRSYALESMIGNGVREVRFAGGCVGNLRKYCEPAQHEVLTLRKAGWRAQLFLGEERCRRAASVWFGAVIGAVGAACRRRAN